MSDDIQEDDGFDDLVPDEIMDDPSAWITKQLLLKDPEVEQTEETKSLLMLAGMLVVAQAMIGRGVPMDTVERLLFNEEDERDIVVSFNLTPEALNIKIEFEDGEVIDHEEVNDDAGEPVDDPTA